MSLIAKILQNPKSTSTQGADERDIDGFTIRPYGCSEIAVGEVAWILREMTQRSDVRKRLLDRRLTIAIIPDGVLMTQLDEFRDLAGLETFDGRSWDHVRGVANVNHRDGRLLVGVGNDRIMASFWNPLGNSTLRHELAHTVHRHGMSEAEERLVLEAFTTRDRDGFIDGYSSSNVDEYFAVATCHYFGKTRDGWVGADWIARNDPALFSIMESLFKKKEKK